MTTLYRLCGECMPGFMLTKPIFDIFNELEPVAVRPSECENIINSSAKHPEHRHKCGHNPCYQLSELRENRRDGPSLGYCMSWHHSLDHGKLMEGEPFGREDFVTLNSDEKMVFKHGAKQGYVDKKQPGDADMEIEL